MPGLAHDTNETKLRKFLKKIVPNYNDSKHKIYGRWSDSISETINTINLNGSIPDMMFLSETSKIAYLGEAKQRGNYTKDLSKFNLEAKEQLTNYISWLAKKNYNTTLIIYSVPIFCVSQTRNEIRRMNKTFNVNFDFKVIY